MKKNQENNFSAKWVKYSDYEIVELNNEKYIKPKEDANYDIYDPFEYADDILVDILNIGKVAHEIYEDKILDTNEEVNELMLDFVKKYGLLGELTYVPLNSDIVHQKKVYLPKNNRFSKKEVMNVEDYLKIFLECDKNNRVQIIVTPNNPIVISNSNEITANIVLDKGIEYNVVFSKGYSEKIVWIVEYAKYLNSVFSSVEIYNQAQIEAERQLYDILIRSFKARNITCRIGMDGKATLIWDFNSLKQAIDTMLSLNETSDRKTVKMCKHCTVAFSSQNIKAEYCSPKCRNQANVYKSRAKNRE